MEGLQQQNLQDAFLTLNICLVWTALAIRDYV